MRLRFHEIMIEKVQNLMKVWMHKYWINIVEMILSTPLWIDIVIQHLNGQTLGQDLEIKAGNWAFQIFVKSLDWALSI